jgi:hypothetical protein
MAIKTTSLEDEMAELAYKEISDEIDFEIMKDLLSDSGWYTVELLTLGSREKSIDIKDWVTEKCKKGFVSRGKIFIFKCKKEAEWFSLRWQ